MDENRFAWLWIGICPNYLYVSLDLLVRSSNLEPKRCEIFLIKHEFDLVELISSSIWFILVDLVISYRVCDIIDIKLSFLPGKKSNSRISELDSDSKLTRDLEQQIERKDYR